MPSFKNGAVEIAYLDEGEGEPIVLVHGFASTKNVNWVYPTWVSELRKSGRRVIALDNRGHGDSAKLYDAAQYSIPIMAGDVTALMDHLEIGSADMMGYSLGSRMTAWLGLKAPQRLRSAILGGIGIGLIDGGGPGENVAAALEAPSLEDVTDPVGRTFRAFADQTRSDRLALAACLRGSRGLMTKQEAAAISVPVLIAVGTADEIGLDVSRFRPVANVAEPVALSRCADRRRLLAQQRMIFSQARHEICSWMRANPLISCDCSQRLCFEQRSPLLEAVRTLSRRRAITPGQNLGAAPWRCTKSIRRVESRAENLRRSIQSGIACALRPKTSYAASRSLPPSSIRRCCITIGSRTR